MTDPGRRRSFTSTEANMTCRHRLARLGPLVRTVCLTLLAGLVSQSARAETFRVTRFDEDLVPGNGCSLREALNAANGESSTPDCPNQDPGGGGAITDVIELSPGTYTISALFVTNALYVYVADGLRADIQPVGNGAGVVVEPNAFVSLEGVTFRDFHSATVFVREGAFATLESVEIFNGNLTALDHQTAGVAVQPGGHVELYRCTIDNSRNGVKGAGIYIEPGASADLVFSTISRSSVEQFGGAVYNQGTFTCINSTLSGNTAELEGGALASTGTSLLRNCTVTDNATLDRSTGAIRVFSGTVSLRNSIVAGQRDNQPSCNGTLTSEGYNLLGSMSLCTLVGGTGDQTNAAPGLSPLAYQGGRTQVHLPNPGSLALDRGNPASPDPGAGACEYIDQRGLVMRPTDSDGDGVARCDIGSVER
jgi:CSLREA domain-containing protein